MISLKKCDEVLQGRYHPLFSPLILEMEFFLPKVMSLTQL